MASFDPSTIANIGASGANPVAAEQGAYQLKDLVDEEQIRGLQLNQAKKQEEEQNAQREILKGIDFSTPQGWMDASQKAAKAGYPDLAISLQRQYQNAVTTQNKNTQTQLGIQESHLRIVNSLANIIGPAAVNIKQTLQTKGYAMAAAQYQAMLPQVLAGLPPEMAARIPRTPPKDPAAFGQLLDAEIARSQQAQNLLKQQDASRKTQIAGAAETERERHDRAQEGLAAKKATNQGFSPDEQALLAALADKHVSLPSGMRSQADIKAEIAGLIKRHPDMTPDQIADGLLSGTLKFTAENTGARVAGTQIGKVALAANELDTFGDQVLAASKALPRNLPVGLTLRGLLQMGQKQASNTGLLTLKLKLQALNNAYDQLASRGGTDTEKRAHIHELFDARLTDEGIQALVTGVKQEAAGARQAADRTIAETSQSAIPGAGAPGSAGGQPPASPAAPLASSGPAAVPITATGPNGQKLTLKGDHWVPLGQ